MEDVKNMAKSKIPVWAGLPQPQDTSLKSRTTVQGFPARRVGGAAMDFNMSFMGGAKREVKRSPGVSAPVDTQRSTETETTNFFDPTKNHSSATGAYASATYEERRYALGHDWGQVVSKELHSLIEDAINLSHARTQPRTQPDMSNNDLPPTPPPKLNRLSSTHREQTHAHPANRFPQASPHIIPLDMCTPQESSTGNIDSENSSAQALRHKHSRAQDGIDYQVRRDSVADFANFENVSIYGSVQRESSGGHGESRNLAPGRHSSLNGGGSQSDIQGRFHGGRANHYTFATPTPTYIATERPVSAIVSHTRAASARGHRDYYASPMKVKTCYHARTQGDLVGVGSLHAAQQYRGHHSFYKGSRPATRLQTPTWNLSPKRLEADAWSEMYNNNDELVKSLWRYQEHRMFPQREQINIDDRTVTSRPWKRLFLPP